MSHQPEWLNEPLLQQLFEATKAAGGEARAVGGCVRDFLLGIDGADVDIASTLTPEKTMAIAKAQGWKAIPTGIEHGTVTLVLGGRPVEVTTLRRDVSTDGRRATVAFTDDWEEDASRRDFTINALYMDAKGVLHDYHDGQKDIFSQRVAFIGDAATRIEEDGLRMLRYFRFLATRGKPPADAEALAAITTHKVMIEKLSGERIANEMRKLLGAENPAYALRLMSEAGLAPLVFGAEIDASALIRMHLLESQTDYQCSVWARVLALLPSSARATAAEWISNRWKLSRNETQQLELLSHLPPFEINAPQHFHTRLIRRHTAPVYMDWLLMQATLQQGLDIRPFVTLVQEFNPPVFPITAKDLLERGMTEGKALGDRLSLLEQQWEESNYQLTKEELLKD